MISHLYSRPVMGLSNKQKRHMKSIALASAKKRKLQRETVVDSESHSEPQSDRSARLRCQSRYDDRTDTAGDENLIWHHPGESVNESKNELKNESKNEPKVEEKAEGESPRKLPTLAWNNSGEKYFRQTYGKGSRSTTKRERKKARGLEVEAKKSLPIHDVWKRQVELGLGKQNIGQRELENAASSAVPPTP